jgi:hypothetical protein
MLAVAVGFALAALTVPMMAGSAVNSRDDAITLLQRRVATLERASAYLRKQIALQIKINSAQARINDDVDGRLSSVENQVANPTVPTMIVSSDIGAPVVIGPHGSGNSTATCSSGKLISGGFDSSYPVEVSQSQLVGTQWDEWAYNPYNDTAILTPWSVCLQLLP